jgi:hypothetical protein
MAPTCRQAPRYRQRDARTFLMSHRSSARRSTEILHHADELAPYGKRGSCLERPLLLQHAR